MKCRDHLKRILWHTQPHWDQDEMEPTVRRVFGKALQCRTAELGAAVYSSENRGIALLSHLQIANLPELCGGNLRDSESSVDAPHRISTEIQT
jgi:hypothetical protein